MRIQLLCTFTDSLKYESVISNIKKSYKFSDNRIFLFRDKMDVNNYILTYNILLSENFKKIPNTISVHRKKQTNTIYTLNAMNCIIKEENGGIFNKQYQLNWELYNNCLILTHDLGYKILELDLLRVFKI